MSLRLLVPKDPHVMPPVTKGVGTKETKKRAVWTEDQDQSLRKSASFWGLEEMEGDIGRVSICVGSGGDQCRQRWNQLKRFENRLQETNTIRDSARFLLDIVKTQPLPQLRMAPNPKNKVSCFLLVDAMVWT
jgi:hypothetical protein